jgi:hypothetical protein
MIYLFGKDFLWLIISTVISIIVSFIYVKGVLDTDKHKLFNYLDLLIICFLESLLISRLFYVIFNISEFQLLEWDTFPLEISDNTVQLNEALPHALLYIWKGIDLWVFLIFFVLRFFVQALRVKNFSHRQGLKLLNGFLMFWMAIYMFSLSYLLKFNLSIAMFMLLGCALLILITFGVIHVTIKDNNWYSIYAYLSNLIFIGILITFFIIYSGNSLNVYFLIFGILAYLFIVLYEIVNIQSQRRGEGDSDDKDVEAIDIVGKDWK